MRKTPYPHQKAAAQYLVNGGYYLYMEPRTGKTLSTILAIEALGARALILAPKSVLPVWKEELEAEGQEAVVIDGARKKKEKLLQSPGHHIITYESSWRLIYDLEAYDVVVFDEALKLQNGNTQVGMHWRNTIRNKYPDRRYWGLSGAPCPESALQLANQMMIMRGHWFGYSLYETYMYMFWSWNEDKYKWQAKKGSESHPKDSTNTFGSASFKVSQKDLNMGEKIFEIRRVKASRSDEKLFELNRKQAINPMDNSVSYSTDAMYRQAAGSGIDAEAKTITGSPTKLLAMVEATKDFMEEDKTQIVIMTRFTTSGKWLAKELDCPHIYGGTSGKDREKYVKAYRKGEQRVLVCQVDAVKMGIDFSANGHGLLMYAEHSWSGDTFIQSTQRVVNIERSSPALIITYVMDFKKDSVDQNIYESVKNKRDFNAKLLEKK